MARYNLIIPDDVYVRLLKLAAEHGMSVGKFMNTVLRQVVESAEGKEAQRTA